MMFLRTLFTTATGVSGLLSGRAAAREFNHMLRTARIALIGVAVLAAVFTLCLLIITAYFLLQIIQQLS